MHRMITILLCYVLYSSLISCNDSSMLLNSNNDIRCISVEFVGRLGNLMFQYSALVGYCAFSNATWDTCAHVVNPKYYEKDLPLKELMYNFYIPYKKSRHCQLNNNKYVEHGDRNVHSMLYDSNVLKLDSGYTIVGYLQSWKYFHPHAEKEIRHIFRLRNNNTRDRGIEYINSIRSSLPSVDYRIVAVHVRLGDKVGNPFYNKWSLSEDYYKKAIDLLNRRHRNVSLVFFTGGAIDPRVIQEDESWTKEHYGASNEHVFFENSHDHFVALQAMMECDAIVVAHSSFSWWAAYLSNSLEIVAPKYMFPPNGPEYNYEDYYLPWWTLLAKNPKEDRIIGINPFN